MTEKCDRCGKQRKLNDWRPGGGHTLRLCQKCIDTERANRRAASADNGGAQPGAGRPPAENPREWKVLIAFTAEEKRQVDAAAKAAGQKTSVFCRDAAIDSAESATGAHKSK